MDFPVRHSAWERAPAPAHRDALPTQIASALAMVALLVVMLGTGLIGIDFGHHWDEGPNLLKITNSVRSNVLLPHWYDYPMMIYWLSLAVLAPSIPVAARSGDFSLLEFTESAAFLMQNRVVFLAISALVVVWVYLGVLAWRRRSVEALLAAALVGLSWEVAYHSRFLAPDAITTQFAGLALMLMLIAHSHPADRRWRRLAAIAVGLATATKYTAGLLLVPLVLLTIDSWDSRAALSGLAVMLVETLFLFGLTFYVVSPGVLLEPTAFRDSLRHVGGVYGEGHEVYTVAKGFEHLHRLLGYLGFALFSRFQPIALVFALLALAGVVATWRDSPRVALLLISFPVLAVLYFGLTSRVMIVRNILPIVPFLAVLAARGTAYAFEALKGFKLHPLVALAVAALLVVNASWLFTAARTIADRHGGRFAREAVTYIADRPLTRFYVTPRVADALGGALPTNATRESAQQADYALFSGHEVNQCLPANRQGPLMRWFGPQEMNYRYYPTWTGDDRIVLMRMRGLRAIGAAGCLPGQ